MMNITRRGFLKLIAASVAAGMHVPAFSKSRQPYIKLGEVADYIGPRPSGFIGGRVVAEIESWDGVGYPVRLWTSGTGQHKTVDRFYDFDLANFVREIPRGFWSMPGSDRYPNVHTWLRVQRFGESVSEAIEHLNFVSVDPCYFSSGGG